MHGPREDYVKKTTFNAETAETAERRLKKLCDLCVLCVKTSYYDVRS
jgi:hypothetical protein